MSRLDKHERGDRIKWGIIFALVAALIVGFFAIVTKGFTQNDPKTWFGGERAEAATVRSGGAVEVTSGAKLADGVVTLSSSLDKVTFEYTVNDLVPLGVATVSTLSISVKDSAGNIQSKDYNVQNYSIVTKLTEEFNLTVGETYIVSGFATWMRNSMNTGQTAEITFQYGAKLPETPSKTGYTFAGWYYDAEFTRPYSGEFIAADTQFYAKFEAIDYSITYNANSGTVDGKTSYNIESETYTLPTPTRTGYNFLGWYGSSTFGGEPVTEIAQGSTGNVTVYAKWEIQTFKVSFFVDNELYVEMTVNYGTRLADLYIVEKATMRAVAFSLDADMLTAYDTYDIINEDISLFAAKDFLICVGLSYNIDGEITTDLLDYNSTLSDLRTPTKDGYTFDGWYYDEDFKQSVGSEDKLTSNTTIYAKFTENTPARNFWNNVGAFFRTWWWCFAVGGAVIVIAVTVAVIEKKKG